MELLKKLTQTDSVSGSEQAIRDVIAEAMAPYADEISEDALGNLICHKKGSGKCRAIVAHMDEIGVIAAVIDDKGFIRFAPVGGLEVNELVCRKVRFANGVIGVIGAEDKFFEKPDVSALYIDIGAQSAEEAQNKVAVGDTAAFIGGFYENDTVAVSKAMDNRAGCRCVIEAARSYSGDNDMYYIFSAQEEVGLRGAKTAAYDKEIESALVLDVTDTGDTPEAPAMAVALGKGAAIKVMDRSFISHFSVRSELVRLARENGIPYQMEIMVAGGTDGGAVHVRKSGVRTGGISIPTRYIHSPSEMISKADLHSCARLLTLWQNS